MQNGRFLIQVVDLAMEPLTASRKTMATELQQRLRILEEPQNIAPRIVDRIVNVSTIL